MASPLRIGIGGALGRMGRVVGDIVAARDDLAVTARFDQPGTEGQTVSGDTLVTREAALAACDVIIDFSSATAAGLLAEAAAARGGPALVLGATGFTDLDHAAVRKAAEKICVIRSDNYSLGVNIMAGLVEQVAARLGPRDWDIEIVESHHRRKVDSPSGTAFLLGEAAAQGRKIKLSEASERGRDGINGPRAEGAIGFASVRGGGIIGEHSVMFVSDDEIITLSHSARDRALFARGAVEAAAWTKDRPAGLYDMMDVLGFRT